MKLILVVASNGCPVGVTEQRPGETAEEAAERWLASVAADGGRLDVGREPDWLRRVLPSPN
jgi:hypothetical protein